MARTAVTYEQVRSIADALYATGVKNPGATAIRAELAKRADGSPVGSPNTIQAHLLVWRQRDRPVDQVAAPALPPQLANDLQRALNAAAAGGREHVEERLAQAQEELKELAASGEAGEARIDELTTELAARTTERDQMAAQVAERTKDVEEVKAALTVASDKVATLERDLHVAQNQAQEATGRVDEIRSSTDKQLEQLRAELVEARAAQAAADKRAVDAEKAAVAAAAHLDGERDARNSERDARKALERRVADLEPLARSSGEVDALKREIALQAQTIAMLRDMLEEAKAKKAAQKPAKEEAPPAKD